MGCCQSEEQIEQRPLAISIDTRKLLRNELPISPFVNRSMSIHTNDLQPLTFQIRINRIKVFEEIYFYIGKKSSIQKRKYVFTNKMAK